jgi:5-methylcytosine-specific restriction endonuclease McrA
MRVAQLNRLPLSPEAETMRRDKIRKSTIERNAQPPHYSGDHHWSYGLPSEKHPSWKGGYPNCMDCGKKLGRYKAKRCLSCSHKGVLAPNWKGGVTKLYNQIRNTFQFIQWRNDIFYRDDFTCQDCGISKVYMEAHHVKSLAQLVKENNLKTIDEAMLCPEVWNTNNGKTLCLKCHGKTHNYKGRCHKILKSISPSTKLTEVEKGD